MLDLNLDEEFRSFLRPLSKDEYDNLEKQLLTEGCFCPLIVWKETGKLIDGFHRLKICTEHNIQYRIKEISFNDKEEVWDWIAEHQSGRRNNTAQWQKYLIGREYRSKVGKPGGFDPDRENVAEVVADRHGISERSVVGAGDYANAVDKLSESAPDVRASILSANVPVRDVVELAKLPASVIQSVAKSLASGEEFKEVQARVAPKTQSPKNGSVKFDDRKISKVIDELFRMLVYRSKALNCESTDSWQSCFRSMEIFEASWTRWFKETTGG